MPCQAGVVDLGHRRHLDRDRKTIRSYVKGERVVGVRVISAPDPLVPLTRLRGGPVVECRGMVYEVSFATVTRQPG